MKVLMRFSKLTTQNFKMILITWVVISHMELILIGIVKMCIRDRSEPATQDCSSARQFESNDMLFLKFSLLILFGFQIIQ